ncbi:MAG: hypothetical protein HS115_15980 [Spirochaetales bacterium]|nr:hypothetical protein [Spirochaetales bacterium]
MHNVRELQGQNVALQLLQHYLKNDPAHLLIFHGPPGTGKTSAAQAFVRQKLCVAGTGCGTCPSCLKVDREHADFIRFPPIKVKIGDPDSPEEWTVRWLIRTRLIYAPFESKSRYVLFPDARLLLPEAETALLKTLEEPPPETFFIIITEDLAFLRETIQSRGVLIPFHYLSREHLEKISGIHNPEELDLLGGSLENRIWIRSDFYPALRDQVARAFEHPLALLELEKYLNEYKIDFKFKNQEISREDLFDFALHEMLRASRAHPAAAQLAALIFKAKTDLRRNMSGLLPYIVSRIFFEMHRTLFGRRLDG